MCKCNRNKNSKLWLTVAIMITFVSPMSWAFRLPMAIEALLLQSINKESNKAKGIILTNYFHQDFLRRERYLTQIWLCLAWLVRKSGIDQFLCPNRRAKQGWRHLMLSKTWRTRCFFDFGNNVWAKRSLLVASLDQVGREMNRKMRPKTEMLLSSTHSIQT